MKVLSDSKYRPCPLLRKMVAAGRLGRKSGEGFYQLLSIGGCVSDDFLSEMRNEKPNRRGNLPESVGPN